MVIKEAQRTYSYLNLYGYPTDAVVCNRIIPAGADGAYFEKWKKAQAEYLRDIEERFSPLPVMRVPLLDTEAVGLKRLAEVGEYLYGRGATQHGSFLRDSQLALSITMASTL
jgi:arsenite-transporting ATPase